MKKLSLKARITLWYTSIVTLVLICVFALLVISIDGYTKASLQKTLKEEVLEACEEINRKGIDTIYTQGFEFYDDGVELVIFNKNNKVLGGKIPHDVFENKSKYSVYGVINKIQGNFNTWYIYDGLTNVDDIYIRGYTSITSAQLMSIYMLKIFMYLMPVLIIFAALVGYFIVKRTLKPIDQIINTAKDISSGNDLSKRINIGNNKGDEISGIANTFDDMFSRLETSFENEKKFTSDASHELRTPISVIMASCDYALFEGSKEEQKEALEIISKQSKKLSILVSQLLMFSRMDHNNINIEKEKIELCELIGAVCDEMNIKAKEKNINIFFDIKDDMFIYADASLMMRVFVNLISNAIKYGKENGYIKINALENDEKLILSVEDNGIGIDENHLDKIWNRFYQVNSSRDDENSLGLGLSMVKSIVELHDGIIEVESKKDIGTKFKIIFKN